MRMIDRAAALAVLEFGELVAHLQRGHRDPPAQHDDLLLEQPTPGSKASFLLRAAWREGRHLGAKLVTVMPDNSPSVNAVYVLFDAVSGRPEACLDGDALTWFKTAADSALGAHYLAREDVQVMTMVGAGALAPYLVRAHRAVRPSLREVRVWNRTRSRAEALAASLATPGLETRVADSLAGAVHDADLVCCATLASEPLIAGDWLRPGTHLDLVGSFTPRMREADDAAIARSRVYVDCRETAGEQVGEIAIPLARGVLAPHDIVADLFELCTARRPGRRAPDEITLFKNAGGGHLDLMTAQFINARVSGAA